MAYELTKMDIAALKMADRVRVSLWQGTGTVEVVRRGEGPTEADPFGGSDASYSLGTSETVRLSPRLGFSHTRACLPVARCAAHLWLYKEQRNHEATILSLLKVGDQIRFDFYPDAGTHSDLRNAGLHHDKLFLVVFRNDKHFGEFEIAESVRPDGHSRMCEGILPEEGETRLITSAEG